MPKFLIILVLLLQASLLAASILYIQTLWTPYVALLATLILAFARLRYVDWGFSLKRKNINGKAVGGELVWGVVMFPTFYAAYSFMNPILFTQMNHYAIVVACFFGTLFIWCTLEALKRIKL